MVRQVFVRLICLLAFGVGASLSGLQSAELRRGPFLQIPTPDGITIRWRTDVACESLVRYGPQSDFLEFSVSDPAPVTEHEVRLSGLTPSTRYFYTVGSPAETLAKGSDFSFITYPPPGDSRPTRVWVIGDAGQAVGNSQLRVRDAYYRYAGDRYTDVWLTLGDNGYFFCNDAEYQTNFFDIYTDLLRRTPVWSTIGNHETWSVGPGQRIPYLDIFSFPANGEAGGVSSGTEEYYSFDYANIHFICLDSMTVSRATDGAMADWLRADLAVTTAPWIIAFWHHPPYSKGSHDSDDSLWEVEMTEMRQNIVPILEDGGVDLVLNGHTHIYERSYLLRGHYGDSTTLRPEMVLDQGSGRGNDTGPYIKPAVGPFANQGTVYVEAGCAGSYDIPFGHHPVMFFDESQMGSLVLDINTNRLDAVFLRDNSAIDDSFTLIKGESAPLRLCDLSLRNGQVILRWKSIRGNTYLVEQTEVGQPPCWQPASGPITALGATTCWTNPIPPGSVHLYRIVQPPPPGPSGKKPALRKPEPLDRAQLPAPLRDSLVAQNRSQPPPPPNPAEKDLPTPGRLLGEGVVCNTTYWRGAARPSA